MKWSKKHRQYISCGVLISFLLQPFFVISTPHNNTHNKAVCSVVAATRIQKQHTRQARIPYAPPRYPNYANAGSPVETYIPKDMTIEGDLTVNGLFTANGGGTIIGTVIGNVIGDVTGNVTGDLTGNVTGNVTGAASLNVLKAGDTMTGNLIMANQTGIRFGETSPGSDYVFLSAPSLLTNTYALMLPPDQGAAGTALYDDGSGNLSWQNPLVVEASVTQNLNGFVNRTDSIISFDDTTRTFTIAPNAPATSYDTYFQGTQYSFSSPLTYQISNITGLHYLNYNPVSSTFIDSINVFPSFTNGYIVTIVGWNATTGKSFYVGEGRHGAERDTTWHTWAHTTIGTKYRSGLDVSGYTLNTDSPLSAAIQVGVADGQIADEDIVISIQNGAVTPGVFFQQPLVFPAQIPVMYLEGAGNTSWKKDTATTFSYKNAGSGTLIQYNQFTAGAWQQTAATDGYFVAYWICATNSIAEPVVSVQGQRQDATYYEALDNNTLSTFAAVGLPFAEVVILGRVILQTSSSYQSPMQAVMRNFTDFRTVDTANLRTDVIPNHNALAGLDEFGAHPAFAINDDTTSFTGILSGTNSDVQSALVAIDANINQPLLSTSSPTFASGSFNGPGTVTVAATVPIYANGGLDVTEAGASDTLNIGVTNADLINIATGAGSKIINIGNSTSTTNMLGTVIYNNVTNLNVTDKLITTNVGGGATTGSNSGLQVEEGGVDTAYIKTSGDRLSWNLLAPATAGIISFTPGASGFIINQGSHNPVTIGTANGLSLVGQVLSLGLASSGVTGALSGTDWNTFNSKQNGSATLTALGSFNSNGLMVQTALNTFSSRNIIGTVDQVNVLNGDGIAGNPTLSLPQSIATTSTPAFAELILNNQGQLVLMEQSPGINTVALRAPASMLGTYTITLPTGGGSAGQVMVNDGANNLSWTSPSGHNPVTIGAAANGLSITAGQVLTLGSSNLANGQLFIGNGTGSPAQTTLTGTANRVTVTNGVGTIALSGPQDMATISSPTFAGMTLSGLTPAGVVHNDGSGVLSSSQIVNADVSATAAIAYSKLNLTGSIVNADINASAAIVDTKLATIATAGKVSNSATTATALNNPNTIVLRDGSGNFAAGTITATLNGNITGNITTTSIDTASNVSLTIGGTQATPVIISRTGVNTAVQGTMSVTGATTLSNLSTGVVHSNVSGLLTSSSVTNAETTATALNTPSAIVARDGSGNFAAGIITANLTGNVAGTVTGNVVTTLIDTASNVALAIGGVNAIPVNISRTGVNTAVQGTMSVVGATTLSNLSPTAGIVHNSTLGLLASSLVVNADVDPAAAIAYSKLNLSNSIVNADISSSAAIVDTKLATITTSGKVANSATTATALNNPNTIVLRDGSGNFAAGTITANLTGNVTGAASLNVLKAGDTMTGNLIMANQTGIRFGETSPGSDYVSLSAPSLLTNTYALMLPPDQGAVGTALYDDGSGNLSWQNPLVVEAAVTQNLNGFVNRTDSIISFDDTTRTFTIAPNAPATSYDTYFQGTQYTFSSPLTYQISNITGLHYLNYNPVSSTFIESINVFPGFTNGYLVTVVGWNATTGKSFYVGEERHGAQRDTTWHTWAHTTIGTKYRSGLDVSGYTLNTDSPLSAAIQVGVANGQIADEDIVISIQNGAVTPGVSFQQPLVFPAQIPVMYLEGAGNSNWKKDTPTTFPYKNAGAGTLIQYNQFTGGAWQQTAATDGYFVAYWICATNSIAEPVVSVQGQRQDATYNEALDNNTLTSFAAVGLPFAEVVILGRIILQTSSSYQSPMQAIMRNFTDFRTVATANVRANVIPNHGSLAGLDSVASHPAFAIEDDISGFTGILSGTNPDVQSALAAIDANINQPLLTTSSPTFASGSFNGPGAVTVAATVPIYANGGLDVTEAGASDTLDIGVTNADLINIATGAGSKIINIGNSTSTTNMLGTVIYNNVTNLNVTDKLITTNVGGGATTGSNSGLQVEEGGVDTAYIKTSGDRLSWNVLAPATAGVISLTPGASGFTINQGSHDPVTIGTANGLSLVGQALSLGLASSGVTGALSGTDWNTFNSKQNGSATLTALGSFNSNGLMVQTALNTFSSRNIVGMANQVNVLNGDGIAGNPTLSLPQSVATTSTPTFAALLASSLDTAAVGTLTLGGATANAITIGNTTSPTSVKALTSVGIVHTSAAGLLSSSAVSLTADVSGVLPVANGGTNSSTALGNNRIMVSNTGSIVEATALTNGQLLIGSTGAAPVAANITGTTNRVTVTNGAGTISLSGPQDLAITSTPTFASETLSATTNQLVLGTTNTTTITATAPVASRTYTVPDVLANASFVMTEGTQTINGSKIFSSPLVLSGFDFAGAITIGGTNATSLVLGNTGSPTSIKALTSAGIVHTSAAGLLSSNAVSLTADVSGVLPVANGGTNASTALGNNRIMVSNTGSIVEATALTNGQLLIGSTGAAPVAANITGTTNRVTVTNGVGTISLTGPQDLATTSTPTFASETLSATINQLVLGTTNTTTITATAPVASRTYTVPDVLENASFVMTEGTQTINGTKTFTSTINGNLSGNVDSAGALTIGGATATSLALGRTGITTTINDTAALPATVTHVSGGTIDSATAAGTINFGTGANTNAVTIGRSGQTTTVNGNLTIGGTTITFASGTTMDSAGAISIGTATATALNLARPGATTAIGGPLTVPAAGTIDTAAAGSMTIAGATATSLVLGRSAIYTIMPGGIALTSMQVVAPDDGGSVTVLSNTSVLIFTLGGGGGSVTNYTITFPLNTTLTNGQILIIATTRNFGSALTLAGNGATINGTVTSLAANASLQFVYYSTNNAWYRIS